MSGIDGVNRISRFRVENSPEGISIEMDLILIYGYSIRTLLYEVQKKVKVEVERLTSLNIKELNVIAKSLVVENKR
mgnify:FL=1